MSTESPMSIVQSIQDAGPCRKQVTVTIPAPAVEKEQTRVLRELGREVSIPGFRKGKVPTRVLRQRFGREIDKQVLDRLLPRFWQQAQAETERPSLILVRTHIGYGSPKQDTADVHGSPLGEAALRAGDLGEPLELAPDALVGDVLVEELGDGLERRAVVLELLFVQRREALEELWGTALEHARRPIDDQILEQTPLVHVGRRYGERDAGVRLSRGPWKLGSGSSVWSGSCETLRQTVPRI